MRKRNLSKVYFYLCKKSFSCYNIYMNKNILTLWDAPWKGEKVFFEVYDCLKRENMEITDILYLYCEQNFVDDEYRQNPKINDGIEYNTKERIHNLCTYFEKSSIIFQTLMIPEEAIPVGKADDIPSIQKAIETYVFPELIKMNPSSLHITLESGTKEMMFSWISLYANSKLTRAFGDNVFLWHFSDDRTKSEIKFKQLLKLNVPKNPYIEAIALEAHNDSEINPVELDYESKIKSNCLLNAPLLLIGERGIGKSTIVETTIYTEKLKQGLITGKGKKKNIQTVVCGQLDSSLADDLLFGHVKGAFTGAALDKTGAVQLADGGILFLDEIHDLPKQTQRKLLRVLQTHKFSQLGATEKELKSDFQLVCASNKTLAELQERLDADFFDRIAVFVTKLKSLRELPESKIEELWKNRWLHCKNKGYILPDTPDSFELVKNVLISSKMYGNIRDIEQLIAYIARDVYQGIAQKSENAKKDAYEEVLREWKKDYDEKYAVKRIKQESFSKELLEKEKWDGMNKLFKKWLAEESEKIFGSQINAAKAMKCEPKTLRNAKG